MNQSYKITIRIIALLLSLLSLSGCFDRRELNSLGIVMGVAIDKAEEEGRKEITLQIARVGQQSSGGSGGKTSKESGSEAGPYFNISNTGLNVNEIIRDYEHKMSRKVYLPHNQTIIISKELAKEGVRDSLDFFARAPEARMTLYMAISRGKASDVLNSQPIFENNPSHDLHHILKGQEVTSQVPIVNEFEFVNKMISKSTAAVLPMVEVIEENEKKTLECTGTAVFKAERMIGELDYKETRGMLFVQNQVKQGIMLVDVLDVRATMEIRKAKSKVKPEIKEDGSIVFKVEVEELVGLGDQTGTVNLTSPENMPKLLEETKKMTETEIQSAVDKAKELNADIFGFGEYIMREYPDKWKELENKWEEKFKDIKVEITVNIKGDGAGRSVKPLTPEEG